MTNKFTDRHSERHFALFFSVGLPMEYFDKQLGKVQYQDIRCHQVTSEVI